MHAPVSVARSIDRVGLVLDRERERVGEDQPALGVGVEHLDGLAVADREHVAGPDRVAARHVLDQRHVADDARLHAERRAAPTSPRSPRRAPAMSVFIVSMPPAVLSDRPPESNTTPLPTSASGLPRAPAGAYVELQEARRLLGALADAEHAAHALRLQLRRRRAPDGDAACRAAACAAAATMSAGDFVARRLVDQVARPRHRVARSPRRASTAALHRARRRADDRSPSSASTASRRLVLEELVAPSTRPSASACAASATAELRCRRRAAWSRPTRPSPTRRAIAAPARRTPSTRELGRVADADEHRGLRLEPPAGRHRERLAELALEAGFVEERGERRRRARRRPTSAPGPSSRPFAIGHGEQVGGDAVGGGGRDGEREGHDGSGGSRDG